MKKPLFLMSLLASFMFSNSLNAQVGISKQTTFTPAESSILDVESADKGVLIPRVKLTATNNFAPLTGNIETSNSLLVYNTEISPTEVLVANKVTPGFYYWETDKWVRVMNPNDQDLRLVGTNNHITKDAGVGGTGTSAGTGSSNIAIGKDVLKSITDPGTNNIYSRNNIGIGTDTFNKLTRGYNNIGLGVNAISSMTTGNNSIGIGINALSSNIINYGNVAIGNESLEKISLGASSVNTAIGYQSMRYIVEGSNNVAIGNGAMRGNQETSNLGTANNKNNIAIGSISLMKNHNGQNNIAIGENALYENVDGSRNIGIGSYNGSSIKNGSDNTFIGSNSGASDGKSLLNFATAIGAGSKVGIDNTIILGRVGTTESSRDKVGIGVTSPTHVLHIKDNAPNTDPVKIEGLRQGAITDALLVVDKDGILKKLSSTQFNDTAPITQKTEELYSIISDQKKQIEELQTVQAELIKRIEKLEK